MSEIEFIKSAEQAKKVNQLYIRENIDHGSVILLTEILVRKIKNEKLPNVKWLQTELQVSFTKLKSTLDHLLEREFIIKLPDPDDSRGKLLDITEKGTSFIYEVSEFLKIT